MTENQLADNSAQTHFFVFVYGTLKRGHQPNQLLADQIFIGKASTTSDYRMYSLGDYPGLKEVDPGSGVQVQGEIYRVDQTCLHRLDQFEVVDEGLYERREVRLILQEEPRPPEGLRLSVDLTTLAYFYLGDTSGCDGCSECW